MSGWLADLSLGVRLVRRRPAYAAAAVLTLALGIGIDTATWSVVDAVLVRPLPYPRPERLVSLMASRPSRGLDRVSLTPADFLAFRSGARAFADLGAFVPFGTVDLTGEGEPAQLRRHLVSVGLLPALGVRPVRGRLFVPEDFRPEGARVALLSARLWRERYGGDPAAVGRRLLLDGERVLVVGILPADFRIPGGDPDLVLPLVWPVGAAADRGSAYLGAIGRLRPGVSLEAARAELAVVARRLERQLPESNRGLGASLLPLGDALAGPARTALLAAWAAVGLVLLVACANVASLQLVRAAARGREMAVRAALGASRTRIARQLLAESAVLAAAGGALGLPLAALALRLLPDPRGVYLSPNVDVRLDARALAYCLAATTLAALASGLAPALRTAGRASALRSGGPPRQRLQGLLVAGEIAAAAMLLSGAGLLLRGLDRLLSRDPGLSPGHVLAFDVALPASRYPGEGEAARFYAELATRLARLPGATAAGAAKEVPPGEPWSFHPQVDGRELPPEASAGWEVVTPGYFAALGTPLLRGRPFGPADRAGSASVALVNRSAARRFLGGAGANPVGRRLRFNGEWHEVVGVVGDQWAPSREAEPPPVVYLAAAQSPVPAAMLRTMTFVVRAAGDPFALANPVRRTLAALDPDLPAARLGPLADRLAAAGALVQSRFNAALLATFAALALALAAVGIYGAMSYLVAARTRELGVRMALGARRGDLLRLVLARGAALALAGLLLGLAGAAALSRLLASLLYGISERDPWTFAAAAAISATAALIASLLPAHRASRLEPVAALREE